MIEHFGVFTDSLHGQGYQSSIMVCNIHHIETFWKCGLQEVLLRLCRQNRAGFSGNREPISGKQLKSGDGTHFKNLGVEINFPTSLLFPNCFHITFYTSKFPLLFIGKYYILFSTIFE